MSKLLIHDLMSVYQTLQDNIDEINLTLLNKTNGITKEYYKNNYLIHRYIYYSPKVE